MRACAPASARAGSSPDVRPGRRGRAPRRCCRGGCLRDLRRRTRLDVGVVHAGGDAARGEPGDHRLPPAAAADPGVRHRHAVVLGRAAVPDPREVDHGGEPAPVDQTVEALGGELSAPSACSVHAPPNSAAIAALETPAAAVSTIQARCSVRPLRARTVIIISSAAVSTMTNGLARGITALSALDHDRPAATRRDHPAGRRAGDHLGSTALPRLSG